jgi:hypothetical protein
MSRDPSTRIASLLKSTTITESPANSKYLTKVYNSRSINIRRQSRLPMRSLRNQPTISKVDESKEEQERCKGHSEFVEGVKKEPRAFNQLWAKMLTNIVRKEDLENHLPEKEARTKTEPDKPNHQNSIKVREKLFNKSLNISFKKKNDLNPLIKPRLIFDSKSKKFHRVAGGRQAIFSCQPDKPPQTQTPDKNPLRKLSTGYNSPVKGNGPVQSIFPSQPNQRSIQKSKLLQKISSISSVVSNNELDDCRQRTESSLHSNQLDTMVAFNNEVTSLAAFNGRNIGFANANCNAYAMKEKEASSRFKKKQRSFFSESKKTKKLTGMMIEAKLNQNITQSMIESKNYGINICAKISQDVSNVIMQSKMARRRLCKELLVKTKEFLIFFKSLNLPKECLFIFPLRPFSHPKSRIFFEAIKLGNVTRVKEMHATVNQLLIYEFDYLHQTGLHIAAKKNDEPMIAALISLGASANSVDIFNRSPLYYAIENKNANVVYRLLAHNASPWSSKSCNYSELARDNQQIKYYIKQFRQLSMTLNMNPRSNREYIRQQYIAIKIKAPKLFSMTN